MRKKLFVLPLLCFTLLCSCVKTIADVEIPESYPHGSLIGWHLNGVVKLKDIVRTCESMPDTLLKYDVECYKIEYVTRYMDELVRAEALIALPYATVEEAGDKQKIAVYCHGTNVPIGKENTAKRFSEYGGPDLGRDYPEIIDCILPLASNGFITVAPEYTGYGSTHERTHCFVYGPELVKSIIDAAVAAKTFSEMMGYTFTLMEGQALFETIAPLYLTGWSQGGAGALATEYYMENDKSGYYITEQDREQFKIVGTSCLSGPYNLRGFIERAFSAPNDFNITTALYSWAAYCINYFDSESRRPCDQIFTLPIYDQTSALMYATTSPAEVFRENFMQRALDGTDVTFCNAMARSSYHKGWCPKAKVFLYHGTDDAVVPFFNSEDAYNNLKAEGASIKFYPYKGKGHTDFVPEYMIRTINDFNDITR